MAFDFIIFTAGIKAAHFIETIDTEKNKQGQVIPDEILRIKGSNNVFVIGDCAQITDKEGNILPPTAQIAEKSAAYVAHTIIKQEKNSPVEPFDAKVDGVFIALGGKYASGILFGKIKRSGYVITSYSIHYTKLYETSSS